MPLIRTTLLIERFFYKIQQIICLKTENSLNSNIEKEILN